MNLQVLHTRVFSALPEERIDVPDQLLSNDLLESITSGIRDGLYPHQHQAVQAAFTGRNVVLTTPCLSGRATVFRLLSLSTVIRRGRTALYLCPTDSSAQAAKAEIDSLLDSDVGKYGLCSAALLRAGGTFPLENARPDIVVTTSEVLASTLLPRFRELPFEFFLAGLGSVVLEDIETYVEGAANGNLRLLLQRLSRVFSVFGKRWASAGADPEQSVQVFVSSRPASNLRQHLERLTRPECEFEVVSESGRGTASVQASICAAEQLVDPRSALDVLVPCLGRALQSGTADGRRVLVLVHSTELTPSDRSYLLDKLQTGPSRTRVVSHVRELKLWGDDPQSFGTVVSTGLWGTWSELWHQLAHVGGSKLHVWIVAPWREALARIEASNFWDGPPRDFPDCRQVGSVTLEKHVAASLAEVPGTRSDLGRHFSGLSADLERSVARKLGVRRSRLSRLAPMAPKYLLSLEGEDRDRFLRGLALDIEGVSPWHVSLQGEDVEAQYLDAHDERFLLAYSDALPFVVGQTRTVCVRMDRAQRELALRRVESPIEAIPKKRLETLSILGTSQYTVKARDFEFGLQDIRVSERLDSWTKAYLDPEQPLDAATCPTGHEEPQDREYATKGLVISFAQRYVDSGLASPQAMHGLAHLLIAAARTLVGTRRRDLSDAYWIHSTQPLIGHGILVYGGSMSAAGVVAHLYDIGYARLLERALQIVRGCPCKSRHGCFGCCQLIDCSLPCATPSRDSSISKDEAQALLEEMLDYESGSLRPPDRSITYTKGNLAELQATVREESLLFLRKKLGLSVMNVAELDFMAPDDPKRATCLGYFRNGRTSSGPLVRVAEGFDGLMALLILVHEYTHNWQWDSPSGEMTNVCPDLIRFDDEDIDSPGNIPFRGNLFIEGFATWAERKAREFFGIRELECGAPGAVYLNEYAQGFHIMERIEEEHGKDAVVEFLKTGRLPSDSRPVEEIVSTLLSTLKVEFEVLQAANQRISEGDLLCVECAECRKDLMRVSHVLPRHFYDTRKKARPEPGWVWSLPMEKLLGGGHEEQAKALCEVLGLERESLPCAECKSASRHASYDLLVVLSTPASPAGRMVQRLAVVGPS